MALIFNNMLYIWKVVSSSPAVHFFRLMDFVALHLQQISGWIDNIELKDQNNKYLLYEFFSLCNSEHWSILQFRYWCEICYYCKFQGIFRKVFYNILVEESCLYREKLNFNAEPPWNPCWYLLKEQFFIRSM